MSPKRTLRQLIYRELLELRARAPIWHERRRGRLVGDEVTLSTAKQAYPARIKVIRRKTGLSAAKQRYPGQSRVIRAKTRLSRKKQRYPRRSKLIQDETRLSATNQGYPGKIKLTCGKTRLSAEKQAYPGVFRVKLPWMPRRGDGLAGWIVYGSVEAAGTPEQGGSGGAGSLKIDVP